MSSCPQLNLHPASSGSRSQSSESTFLFWWWASFIFFGSAALYFLVLGNFDASFETWPIHSLSPRVLLMSFKIFSAPSACLAREAPARLLQSLKSSDGRRSSRVPFLHLRCVFPPHSHAAARTTCSQRFLPVSQVDTGDSVGSLFLGQSRGKGGAGWAGEG